MLAVTLLCLALVFLIAVSGLVALINRQRRERDERRERWRASFIADASDDHELIQAIDEPPRRDER